MPIFVLFISVGVSLDGAFPLWVSLNWQFFSDQNFPKTELPFENGKIALVHASMVVTYYIKLFRTRAERHNGILMSLLLLVAKTIILFDAKLSVEKVRCGRVTLIEVLNNYVWPGKTSNIHHTKKWSSPLKIYLINMNKSVVS